MWELIIFVIQGQKLIHFQEFHPLTSLITLCGMELAVHLATHVNNPPWFIKHLLTPTADDVEMRVCRNQDRKDEDILIEQVELMVR